jgi:hypothetical protein
MALNSDREKLMRLYLLGRLSDQETSELESEYVVDEARFEEILAVEDDLRDAYARSELSSSDREAFEKRFLALPDQRQKLEFAKILHQYLLQAPPSSRVLRLEHGWLSGIAKLRGRPPIAVAAAIVLIFVILGLGGRWLERSRQRALQTVLTSPSSPGSSPSPSGSIESPATQIVTFVLTPGLVRGSEQATRLLVPKGANRIRLDLRFEDGGYAEYQATLETAENKPVWSQDRIAAKRTAAGSTVVVDVPANLLATGDYVATLRARTSQGRFQGVADYGFRVVKE